ncbi:MAG: helix-turn-helix domain-containing protein [Pelomonas sp.]|nr:helix-turn-helix domain-containing protein [Roseateles sp.]
MTNFIASSALETLGSDAHGAREAAPSAPRPDAGHHIADTLNLVAEAMAPRRRIMRGGERLYQIGAPLSQIYLLNSGMFKLVGVSTDGREQIAAFKFRGDWLGLGEIDAGRHTCDAVALDTCEVWSVGQAELFEACARRPALLRLVVVAMSGEILREREAAMSAYTLPADARMAEFLHRWINALERRGLRADLINLPLTRAEIGNHLGMTLETASRALSRLAQARVISIDDKSRREITVHDAARLDAYVRERSTSGTAGG